MFKLSSTKLLSFLLTFRNTRIYYPLQFENISHSFNVLLYIFFSITHYRQCIFFRRNLVIYMLILFNNIIKIIICRTIAITGTHHTVYHNAKLKKEKNK